LRALGDVGLVGEVLDRSPSGLSGGQLQRVSIARSLACAPQLLIADEATASLDVSAQQQIIQLLVELVQSREMSLVMISHDLHLTRSVADRVVVMRAGRVVEEGPTEQIFENPATEYTRDLLASAFLDA
jgi:ABC-type dipeptide/oligopeptide/nickel transport system ATPase component